MSWNFVAKCYDLCGLMTSVNWLQKGCLQRVSSNCFDCSEFLAWYFRSGVRHLFLLAILSCSRYARGASESRYARNCSDCCSLSFYCLSFGALFVFSALAATACASGASVSQFQHSFLSWHGSCWPSFVLAPQQTSSFTEFKFQIERL